MCARVSSIPWTVRLRDWAGHIKRTRILNIVQLRTITKGYQTIKDVSEAMSKYSWFIDFLLQKGWLLKPLAETQEDYSSAESKRVLALIKATPLNFQAFIQSFKELSSRREDAWFLSYSDYLASNEEGGFSWNEYEQLSIQAAEEDGDDEEIALLSEFWNSYLPFAYSIRNGYSYLAIGVSGINEGKIIYGREPMFEEYSIEADSFEELLDSFVLTLTAKKESIRLLEFI